MGEESVQGMSAIVTALTTGLSADNLLAVFAQVIPFVVVIVPAVLGIYFLRKLIKGASKAKVRL